MGKADSFTRRMLSALFKMLGTALRFLNLPAKAIGKCFIAFVERSNEKRFNDFYLLSIKGVKSNNVYTRFSTKKNQHFRRNTGLKLY